MDFALHLNFVALVQMEGKIGVVSIMIVFRFLQTVAIADNEDTTQLWPKCSFIWSVLQLNWGTIIW